MNPSQAAKLAALAAEIEKTPPPRPPPLPPGALSKSRIIPLRPPSSKELSSQEADRVKKLIALTTKKPPPMPSLPQPEEKETKKEEKQKEEVNK